MSEIDVFVKPATAWKKLKSGMRFITLSFDDVENKFGSLFTGDSQTVRNFVKKLKRRFGYGGIIWIYT
ncbi:MAG: hypothetical protein H5T46_05995 [Archaeoglobi archaeon]|nr:hypothetical protein [Candidatus Mnemosynella sp.]